MEQLWQIIAIAVGIISIGIPFLTRKKKQTNQDNAILTLGIVFVALGIVSVMTVHWDTHLSELGVLLGIVTVVRRLRKKV